MNIIVEGVDGVGKDSFIERLAELTDKKVMRGSSFEISQLGPEKMYEKLKEMIVSNDDLIINRFFYSNVVYGELYDYPMLSHEQYTELNDLVCDDAIVYYLVADTEIIKKRINNRGDDMVKPEEIQTIKDAYVEMWEKYTPRTIITIDTNDSCILDKNSHIYKSVLVNDLKLEELANNIEGDLKCRGN